jgi:hypothetical protein
VANASDGAQDDGGLRQALREARLAEAAHYDAALALRDSKTLRLHLLQDELVPLVRSSPDAAALFDLALVPGEPPKLWIDLISHVVMEPDHRTYRLVEDRRDGKDVLFETTDRAEMAAEVRRRMAHRLVARARQAAAPAMPAEPAPIGYSQTALVLAWTSGFAFGALALLGAAVYLGVVGG